MGIGANGKDLNSNTPSWRGRRIFKRCDFEAEVDAACLVYCSLFGVPRWGHFAGGYADSWWFCLVELVYGLSVNFIPVVAGILTRPHPRPRAIAKAPDLEHPRPKSTPYPMSHIPGQNQTQNLSEHRSIPCPRRKPDPRDADPIPEPDSDPASHPEPELKPENRNQKQKTETKPIIGEIYSMDRRRALPPPPGATVHSIDSPPLQGPLRKIAPEGNRWIGGCTGRRPPNM